MTVQHGSAVLLDTDVFSFIYKNSSEARRYLPHLVGAIPCLTFVTIAELYRWAYGRRWGQRKLDDLGARLSDYLLLPIDEAVAQRWARIQTSNPGRTFPQNDCWIAACALTYQCTLLTHNGRDFSGINGLTAISYGSR